MATHETNSNLFDLPSYNVVPSFSFSGCGFLGVYHVGVAACLRDHTDVVNRKEIKFAGASAGAIVATTLLCDIDFGEVTRLLLKVAWAVRNKEHIDLAQVLRDLMNKYLPDNAHELLSGRLYISVTMLRGLQGALVTDFHSKEHLIECLIATSFIPGFLGWIPPGLEGEDFVDIANGVLLSTALGECCTTDSESASDEDDEVDWKQDKNKKTVGQSRLYRGKKSILAFSHRTEKQNEKMGLFSNKKKIFVKYVLKRVYNFPSNWDAYCHNVHCFWVGVTLKQKTS